jgi:hypothetical protein
MIFTTKDLKEFLRLSRTLKQNKVLPLLDFIKLEPVSDTIVRLTKTNLQSYIQFEIESGGADVQPVLIDEKKLSLLLSNTNDDVISIKEKKTTVTLCDDKTTLSFQKEDVKLFPQSPDIEDTAPIPFSRDVLSSISIAKSYITEVDIPTQWSYVFIVPKGEYSLLYGAEMSCFYMKKIDEVLPKVALTKEAATAIGLLKSADYYSKGNYDIFKGGNIVMGFIKNESKPIPVERLWNRVVTDSSFNVSTADIIGFCDMATSMSSELLAAIKISESDTGFLLKYKSPEEGATISSDIAVEKSGTLDDLEIVSKTLYKCLKPLPYERITIRQQREGNHEGFVLLSQDDPSYFGIVMGITKQ